MILDYRPALRAFLLADAGIAQLVGNVRVFEFMLPQSVRAASLVYQGFPTPVDHTMQGPTGLAVERVQIDAYALSQDAATDLANRVKARLDGYRGEWPMTWLPGSPVPTLTVQGVFFEGGAPILWDADADLARKGFDFMVHFIERAA